MRLPLEAIKAVTVGNLSQVLDHRITRSLGRTAHVVRFLEGGELRHACDHLGRLTELASLGLSCTVIDDCTVVFNPLRPEDLGGWPAASGRCPRPAGQARLAAAVNHARKGGAERQSAPWTPRKAAPAFARNP